ncbi:reelin domain-containing protein 1-like [Danio aesculapii]|uniref:reelin domain-containing protein 1-like n=1 Tax=Danio aesculapii TaxID=1142201 RepID=UPI0024BF595B|nr:reelin domain-containing protein 1-like [Danio aesculapii]
MMLILMKAVLAGCVLVCVFPCCGVCFSRGASVSSCVNMKPGHISSFPQHTHSAISIRSSRSVYLPQHTLTVTVQSSRAFMGFLLQARSVLEDRLIGGEFTLHTPGTHTLSCLRPDDTVTHSHKMLKRNLSFSWRAPAQPSGDLRFYITLVQSYFVYWSRIRSAVVHDGTRSSQSTKSVTGQPLVNTSEPSPALRRSSSEFFPSREPTEGAVSLTRRKNHASDLFGVVLKPPKQPKTPSGAPEGGGKMPERVPSHSASELGLLLGLSAALGMAVAVGLRYLQRKHCRKRTAVSLNDRHHDDRGIIHVQECGDLVQVRKIRQNSFLVLQAEYNLITPQGN